MRVRWAAKLGVPLVMVLSLLVSACSSTATGAPSSIPVGAVVPLTGRYAGGGAQVKAGYELAVEKVNQDGGVFVKQFNKKIPLELILLDDESDPAKTVDRLEKLYSTDKVMAYFGGFGSDLHAAGAAIGDKNKVPYLGVAFALLGIHQQGYKYLFSPFVKSDGIAKGTFAMLNSIPKEQRPKKLAIFQESTDWGIELAELWKKEAAANGYEIAVVEQYSPGTKDYSTMITKSKAANVEGVLALPGPPDGIAIMKQIKDLGLNAKFYFLVRAPDIPTWGKDLGTAGDYVIGGGFVFSPSLNYPGAKELNSKFQEKFGRPGDLMLGPAYSIVEIVADAISRAEKYDRESIRDALTKTDMMTVQGRISFKPDGTANAEFNAFQWLGGQQSLIWPPEQAGKKFSYPAPPWDKR